MTVLRTRGNAIRLLGGILLLAGFGVSSLSAQVSIADVTVVDVTTRSFSVAWETSSPSSPGITVFSDAAGLDDITGQLTIVPYPLLAGDPTIVDEFDLEDSVDDLVDTTRSRSLSRIRVEGLAPATTYFFQVHSDDGGTVTTFPSGSTSPVTTATDEAFVAEAKILVVTVTDTGGTGVDPFGWIVTASNPNTLHPVSAVVGDGVEPDQVFLNFANFHDLAGVGWTPLGAQSFQLDFNTGPGIDDFTLDVILDFDGGFVTGEVEEDSVDPPFFVDTDMDGMSDPWEIQFFGNLDRDGTGDFDGDGVLDLDEYLLGGDPTQNNLLVVPKVYSPRESGSALATSELSFFNRVAATGSLERVFDYEIQMFLTSDLSVLASQGQISSGGLDTTDWPIPTPLLEDAYYTVRVRATDGFGVTQWSYRDFVADAQSSSPTPFFVSRPSSGSTVDTTTPTLEVTNSSDPEEGALSYVFEVFADVGLTTSVAISSGLSAGPAGTTAWLVDPPLSDTVEYFWTCTVSDPDGLAASTPAASFTVDLLNSSPTTPVVSDPLSGTEVTTLTPTLEVQNSTDADMDPLTYRFEIDRVNTFDSPNLQVSGPLAEGVGTTGWLVPALTENTQYYWRAIAEDPTSSSAWVTADFFVNVANDPPAAPIVRNPGTFAWVAAQRPLLETFELSDPDGVVVDAEFEVYADALLTALEVSGSSSTGTWVVPIDLTDSAPHYWRVRAVDDDGLPGSWTNSTFFVNTLIVSPPFASAGDDASAETSGPTLLDGSASNEATGGSLEFVWDLPASPMGSTVDGAALSDPADVRPEFTPDLDGRYVAEVRVTDGEVQDVDWASIDAFTGAVPPNANAGPPQNALTGQMIALDGSASFDPDDAPTPLVFSWSFFSVPAGSLLTNGDLVGPGLEVASFAPDVDGVYLVGLEVSDGAAIDMAFTVVLAASADIAPNANAGDDFLVDLMDLATLDGTGSFDPDGLPAPLSYSWRFLSVPAASVLTDTDLVGGTTATPDFLPDVLGNYLLGLTVSDGTYEASDNVVVTVETGTVLPMFIRGNCNGLDAAFNIADAIFALEYLFVGTSPPPPPCFDACDSNDDGQLNIADPIVALAYLFILGTPPLPIPNVDTGCGIDPTADALDCLVYPAGLCP